MMTKTIVELPRIYFTDEDKVVEYFCNNIAKCNERMGGNESDPVGCYGCESAEEYLEKVFNKHHIENSAYGVCDFVVDTDELSKYLSSVMNVRNNEKQMRKRI